MNEDVTIATSINKYISEQEELQSEINRIRNKEIHGQIRNICIDIVKLYNTYKNSLDILNIPIANITISNHNWHGVKLNDNYYILTNHTINSSCDRDILAIYKSKEVIEKSTGVAFWKKFIETDLHRVVYTELYSFTFDPYASKDKFNINQYMINYEFLFTEEFTTFMLNFNLELQSIYTRLKEYYKQEKIDKDNMMMQIENDKKSIDKVKESMININSIVTQIEGELNE